MLPPYGKISTERGYIKMEDIKNCKAAPEDRVPEPLPPVLNDATFEAYAEHERRTNGKRFSTYYEAYGRLLHAYEAFVDEARIVGDGVAALKLAIRNGVYDEDFAANVQTTWFYVMQTLKEAVSVAVVLEKLKGGVVHAPK